MSHVGPSAGCLDLCLIWSTWRAQEIMKVQGSWFKEYMKAELGYWKLKQGRDNSSTQCHSLLPLCKLRLAGDVTKQTFSIWTKSEWSYFILSEMLVKHICYLRRTWKMLLLLLQRARKNHLTQFSKNILPTLIVVIIKLIMPIKMCLRKSRK